MTASGIEGPSKRPWESAQKMFKVLNDNGSRMAINSNRSHVGKQKTIFFKKKKNKLN